MNRGTLISKDSEALKMINKKNMLIVAGIFVFAAVVGLIIGFANRVVVDPKLENAKLVQMYEKTKNTQYTKHQEVILPEKNTPINRIPKVEVAAKQATTKIPADSIVSTDSE